MKNNSHTGLECDCTQTMSPWTLKMIYKSYNTIQYDVSPAHVNLTL